MGPVHAVKGYAVWFCYPKWRSEEIEISLKTLRPKLNDNDYADSFVSSHHAKTLLSGMWFCLSYLEYISINFEVSFLTFDFHSCLLCGRDFTKIILFVGYQSTFDSQKWSVGEFSVRFLKRIRVGGLWELRKMLIGDSVRIEHWIPRTTYYSQVWLLVGRI